MPAKLKLILVTFDLRVACNGQAEVLIRHPPGRFRSDQKEPKVM